MRKSIYILFLILVVSGCNGKISPEKRGIRLNVGVSGLDTETKAPFVDGEFTASVWFSYSPGTYPDDPSDDDDTNLPNRIVTTFTSDKVSDIKDESGKLLQYPITDKDKGNTKIYCTGFYPSDGWRINESQTAYSATHPIDGVSDLMFAEQIAGSYQENFGDFTFNHLLTWISFNASATSVDAAAIWGNITKLTITTPQSLLTVTLSESIGTPSTVNYSGETSVITVPQTSTSTPLSIKAVDLGSALCSPPYSKVIDSKTYYGYDISVTTNGIGTKAIFVPLYDTNSHPITDPQAAIGKQYVISLYFNEVSVVSGVCTLKYWEDEREDLYVDRPGQAS